jgi:hypothetical protein
MPWGPPPGLAEGAAGGGEAVRGAHAGAGWARRRLVRGHARLCPQRPCGWWPHGHVGGAAGGAPHSGRACAPLLPSASGRCGMTACQARPPRRPTLVCVATRRLRAGGHHNGPLRPAVVRGLGAGLCAEFRRLGPVSGRRRHAGRVWAAGSRRLLHSREYRPARLMRARAGASSTPYRSAPGDYGTGSLAEGQGAGLGGSSAGPSSYTSAQPAVPFVAGANTAFELGRRAHSFRVCGRALP